MGGGSGRIRTYKLLGDVRTGRLARLSVHTTEPLALHDIYIGMKVRAHVDYIRVITGSVCTRPAGLFFFLWPTVFIILAVQRR